MEGLGQTIENLILKGVDVYTTITGQKLQAQTAQAQAQSQTAISTANANTKKMLYLGIGVVGAALLIGLVKKSMKG